MKSVSFIFGVLADVAKYAGKTEMVALEKAVVRAQRAARNEIEQAKSDSNYRAVMEAVFPEIKEMTIFDSPKR